MKIGRKICFSSISQTAACRVIDPMRRYQSTPTDKDPFLGRSSRILSIDEEKKTNRFFLLYKIRKNEQNRKGIKTNGIGYNLDEIPSHKSNTKSFHNAYKRWHYNRLEYSPKDNQDKVSFFSLQTIFFRFHSTIRTILDRYRGQFSSITEDIIP